MNNHKSPIVSEQFELHSITLHIGKTKSKSPASSIVVQSTFVIHVVNEPQFLNDTCVAGAAVAVTLPLTKK